MVRVLRWVAVLPAALLAFVIAAFIAHFITLGTFTSCSESPMIEITDKAELREIELMLLRLLGPASFVYFGTLTAPCRKRATAIALASIMVTAFVGLYVLVLVMERIGAWSFWHGVAIVSVLASTFAGVRLISRKAVPA